MKQRFKVPKKKRCLVENKVRYPDKKAALKRMRMLQYAHDEYVPIRAYQCADCGGWHLSSKHDIYREV